MGKIGKQIWFSGVGELEAPYNGYKGRWLSLLDVIDFCEAKIITTNYVHSRNICLGSDFDSRYIILKCSDYKAKRGLKRLIYHWIYMIKFSYYLLCNVRKVDTIIFNAIPHINVIGLLLARILGKRVFLDVRDLWLDLGRGGFSKSFALVNRILFRVQVLVSDEILVTSIKYGHYINRNFHFLPLGYDNIHTNREFHKDNIIGYIGNQSPQYDLVNAVARLESVSFKIQIIGSFDFKYQQSVKEANSNLDIEFLGYIDSEERKLSLMAKWSFGLIPNLGSSQMGLPTKIFDYLKYGIPLLYIYNEETNNDIEIRSFISSGFGRMHNNLNLESYDETEQYVLNHRDIYNRERINTEYLKLII